MRDDGDTPWSVRHRADRCLAPSDAGKKRCSGFARERWCRYLCSRVHDNQLGITAGASGNLKSYYDDVGAWAPIGDYNASTTIPGTNVPISCVTNKLNFAEDGLFEFDVHIGIQPPANAKISRSEVPQRVVLTPVEATVPEENTFVVLPNGKEAMVAPREL